MSETQQQLMKLQQGEYFSNNALAHKYIIKIKNSDFKMAALIVSPRKK